MPRLRALVGHLWLRLICRHQPAPGVFLALAVLSYAPQDSSLNSSGGEALGNWLGHARARLPLIWCFNFSASAVWLMLLPLGARAAARQLTGSVLSHPNWRFLAAIIAPLLMALALALGGRQVDPLAPIPGGALGDLLADGVETALAAFSLFMSPQVELTAAYGLGGLAVLAALFGSGLVRLSGQAAWRLLRGARHLRHGPRAYTALRGMVAVFHPGALKNRLPLRTTQQGDASAAFEVGDDIDVGFIDNDASSASQVHVADKRPAPKTGRRAAREAQTKLAFDKSTYELPPLRLLTEHKKPRQTSNLSKDALEANARMLKTVLADFGIKGTIGQVRPGRS